MFYLPEILPTHKPTYHCSLFLKEIGFRRAQLLLLPKSKYSSCQCLFDSYSIKYFHIRFLLKKSQIKGNEYQDDAYVCDEPFPKSVPEK